MADVVIQQRVNQRLLKKFLVGDDCWEWQRGCVGGGYGLSWDGEHKVLAHRHVYQVLVGPIPEGLTLDHLCRNRKCVRPDHLEPVTIGVNVLRGDTPAARNAAKTHCVAGHPYDVENTYRYKNQRHCKECKRRRLRSYRAKAREVA